MEYWVIAFYSLVTLDDPHGEVLKHKEFFKTRDLFSRIYISEQGINAQMSGRADHAQEYIDWLRSDSRHANISFKIHLAKGHVFPKATIKYRKQLVALDYEVDLKDGGQHVDPSLWRQMLEEKNSDTLILDVRNDYESKVGHFAGAELPKLDTFREFVEYTKELKEKRDPKKTKVMMYCTGGIRCEYYSAVMKNEGFEEVYQLSGGVIQYGLDEGQANWEGKLFVFDDRLVIPISGEEAPAITVCKHCEKVHDVYYNCANMDCNDLFISCPECLKREKGCCSEKCLDGRVRPIAEDANPRPFRKWNHEEKAAMRKC